jgi:hypothetical protein
MSGADGKIKPGVSHGGEIGDNLNWLLKNGGFP